jgi:hypothetical protein
MSKPSSKGILNFKERDTLNNSSSSISAFINNLRIMSGKWSLIEPLNRLATTMGRLDTNLYAKP